MLAHAQRHAQNHSTRRKRVIGNPVYEAPQLGLERRQIELFLDILEAVVKSSGLLQLDRSIRRLSLRGPRAGR